jgi:hypothetical protein
MQAYMILIRPCSVNPTNLPGSIVVASATVREGKCYFREDQKVIPVARLSIRINCTEECI